MREFKYFLDSNIFLRPIVKDNFQKVRECEILFRKIKKGEIKAFTSSLVLAEIVWVGRGIYKLKRGDMIRILKGILDFKHLKIVDNFNSYIAVEIYKNHNIKFIDTLIASNPQIFKKEATVISYDKDFDKIKVIRKEPKEIIKKIA